METPSHRNQRKSQWAEEDHSVMKAESRELLGEGGRGTEGRVPWGPLRAIPLPGRRRRSAVVPGVAAE